MLVDSGSLKICLGTLLVSHWLGICFVMQGLQVQSLVRELRSHMVESN